MWARKQYEDAAQRIGDAFVASHGAASINDLSLKTAQEHGLNPEGIRTIVRLANVAAFENMFSKAAADEAEDRMFEFAVGDAELVISQLHQGAKLASCPSLPCSYDRTTDYYGDVPKTVGHQKVASAYQAHYTETGIESKSTDRTAGELRMLFKIAEERMRAKLRDAQIGWLDTMDGAAKLARVACVTKEALHEFEKDAAACGTTDIAPELRRLHHTLTGDLSEDSWPIEKIAELREYRVVRLGMSTRPIYEMLKTAAEHRVIAMQYSSGLERIAGARKAV